MTRKHAHWRIALQAYVQISFFFLFALGTPISTTEIQAFAANGSDRNTEKPTAKLRLTGIRALAENL